MVGLILVPFCGEHQEHMAFAVEISFLDLLTSCQTHPLVIYTFTELVSSRGL